MLFVIFSFLLLLVSCGELANKAHECKPKAADGTKYDLTKFVGMYVHFNLLHCHMIK